VISGEYRGTFNFRLGGELKFNTIMTRLGAAYSTDPYKDGDLKANRLQLSGGLGYRHKGIFIDLTYVHTRLNDVDFGYRLQDKANTFASLKNRTGQVVLGLGVKF
jgi:long-subunit fatty acid transport protein